VVTTSCDKGDNDKEVSDFDEELAATVENDSMCQAWQPADHFKNLLEATSPNHTYPVRHKLKECTMMKNCMTTWTFAKGKKPDGDSTGKVVTPFPEEKVVMSIYGGPTPHESRRKLKLTSQAINLISRLPQKTLPSLSPQSLLTKRITQIASPSRGGFLP
jgi:hypothetical protein